MVNISVIIAAYNEEKNIIEAIQRTRKIMPNSEIIVVDDGSEDKTAEVAEKIKDNNLKVIRLKRNRGKGKAIQVGIDNATYPIMAQVDADCQFPPEELPKIIEPIINGETDIVFASRFIKGSVVKKGSLKSIRRFANFVVSGFTSIMCGKRLTDVNAGFKAWKSDVIRDIRIISDRFAYEPEIAIMTAKKGYKIVEVPVTYFPRKEGKTNVSLIKDGIMIILGLIIIKIFRR